LNACPCHHSLEPDHSIGSSSRSACATPCSGLSQFGCGNELAYLSADTYLFATSSDSHNAEIRHDEPVVDLE
ncbi:MAG: hypothetical protein VX950_00005, partial [Pseudomonadota bacterium]|nr:hypothetical protein [Pseudomonadota bacterium]